jgi:shikimate dehydrogenase
MIETRVIGRGPGVPHGESRTIKAFVVGHPIGHSRSPLIHGHWLKRHRIAGSYERIDVAPDAFADFLLEFGERGFVGGNVTIPHKEVAFNNVDRRTERAERLGAVNTLWLEDGLLWGDNTDVLGFMAHLDETLGDGWERGMESALVLGAGGAARAIVAGLVERPIGQVMVSNRTSNKAVELVSAFRDRFDRRRLDLDLFSNLDALVRRSQLIVNTTSLGMAGQPALDLDLSAASTRTVVADIVYVPLKTPLLSAAEARGLRTVDGLGMLLHQAVPGFARWFGVTPEVTRELRALLVRDIEGRR